MGKLSQALEEHRRKAPHLEMLPLGKRLHLGGRLLLEKGCRTPVPSLQELAYSWEGVTPGRKEEEALPSSYLI